MTTLFTRTNIIFRTIQYAKVNHSTATSERECAGTSHRPYGFLLQHLVTLVASLYKVSVIGCPPIKITIGYDQAINKS